MSTINLWASPAWSHSISSRGSQTPPLLSKPFPHPQEAGGVGSVGQPGPEEAASALGPAQPFLDRGCEQIP